MNVTIIADASWCPEEHVGGYGYWIASGRGKFGGGGQCMNGGVVTSSIVAEMQAMCNALYIALDRALVMAGDEVLIQTDCMAAIQAFQGLRHNLVEQERSAVQYMHRVATRFGLVLRYRHVKGHTSNDDARSVTNRLCDKRAKESMRAARTKSKAQKLKRYILEGINHVSHAKAHH